MHFAAESHVDRSIDNPANFVDSNILGTFNLLEAVREFLKDLGFQRKKILNFCTLADEVFGSLNETDYLTNYQTTIQDRLTQRQKLQVIIL